MKYWKSWKLHTKLVLSFSVILALSFIATGVFYYYSSVNEVKKQSLQLLGSNSAQVSRSIELFTEDLEKLSLSVFNDPVVQRAVGQNEKLSLSEQADLTQQVTSHLLNLTMSWPDVQGIYLYSVQQKELTYFWSKRSPPVGYTIDQEPWYPYDGKGRRTPFLLWPTMRENTITNFLGEQVFSLVRPINQIPTGKLIGYMKIDIHAEVFNNLVSLQADKSPGSKLYITTDEDQVVYDNQDLLTGKNMSGINAPELLQARSTGTINWQGQDYLYGFYRSDYTQWTTLILTPISAITKQLKVIRNTVMGIEAVVLILVVAIAWIIATGVTRPLRKMIVTMKHVERGDFTVRAEYSGHRNEISLLGKVFNKMLDSLQEMITKVYMAEIREKDARLVALQAQINPHFLFNTLTILKSLGRKGASADVVEVTESLAHLFRYSLYDWDRTVELREELHLVNSYIKIQKYRFQDRFVFQSDIPEELLDAKVLRLMIQPLVENAIVHGLEHRKEGGIVAVSVRSNGGVLEIKVTDNGIGMDAGIRENLRKKLEETHLRGSSIRDEHMGIALVNIQKRLVLIYGNDYGLTIENGLEGGTAVILKLPFQRERKEEERHEDHTG
ncbi:sensor histidine kinase [Paenibacillus sp. HN-1]|uniref:cache domain-containing sensor histidine kinase n=1 Tax=Paenibacillus TaxID=44249 RepID=UPI001CA99503|nr:MULTISPECIES: sensor histidine kinase [Paenibacillus]MBY9080728.1 sensor histidine kinase [Paenibacillus sp. CGMCC 1.18879]MBY9085280.1 sensor histidine kinase [Paenibacillus sinensis]